MEAVVRVEEPQVVW